MTPPHCIDAAPPRTDPFRWEQVVIAAASDHFDDPDHATSQRQYAQQHGIPRATLGYWLRQPAPEGVEPDLVCFFRSSCGLRLLRRVVLALFVVFVFRGACGLRLLSAWLRLTQLDRFVASSTGALHEMSRDIETDLGVFGDCERARLAEGMKHRHIALAADENFHGPHVCLVAAEPSSNFIVVEQYAEHRDERTWTAAVEQGTAGLNVTVLLLSTDAARGLIACAHNGLAAQHLPELFHGQRPLCQALTGPLERQKEAADKQLQQARQDLQECSQQAEVARSKPRGPGRPKDYDARLARHQTQLEQAAGQAQACQTRKEEAHQAVRGLADDYHPFDSSTGAAVKQAEIQKRLEQRLRGLERVAEQAELGGKSQETLARGYRWIDALVFAMEWYWGMVEVYLEELDLPEEVEQAFQEKLLPGLYWQQAAPRARTAEERHRREDLAERLLKEAWAKSGALSRLEQDKQQELKRVAGELVGLFARSSSCVEGRNGRLALFHHGQTRLSAARLKALTVVHNYHSTRADGTTAAERFFGKKPRDLFSWLLERLPDLPRPAAKRPNKGPQTGSKPG